MTGAGSGAEVLATMFDSGAHHAPLFIISGAPHSGKTSLLMALLQRMTARGWRGAGIVTEGHWQNGQRSGFTLIDLRDGRRTPLAVRQSRAEGEAVVPYRFFAEGMAAGKRALAHVGPAAADVAVVDEVGQLELRGQGWAGCLDGLLALPVRAHLWVVKSSCVTAVCLRWRLRPCQVVEAGDPGAVDRLAVALTALAPEKELCRR